MSHSIWSSASCRRAFVAALALTAAAPAAAEAASPWQFSDFRFAGGTRFTLTLSKAQQLPGIDPAIWPKGYRYVCGTTGPVLRHKVNRWTMDDTAEMETYLGYAKPGALVYTRLGNAPHWSLYTTNAMHEPRTVETGPITRGIAYEKYPVNPAKAPVAPLLGLYNLQAVPYSSFGGAPFATYLPAAVLSAKLDVRQGTAEECPTPETRPSEYFRASR